MSNPNAVSIDIRVPPDADVFFDGKKTTQRGVNRHFVTPPLEEGKNYSYQVKATWNEDGKEVTRTRDLPVQAGQRKMVDFLSQRMNPDGQSQGEQLNRPSRPDMDQDRTTPGNGLDRTNRNNTRDQNIDRTGTGPGRTTPPAQNNPTNPVPRPPSP
jgi:uncharacterized protein (TIGR03000 family)